MKLTIEGTPEEIEAFLAARAPAETPKHPSPVSAPVEPRVEAAGDEPKPPSQTIAPVAIERLEFGVDQAGSPVDIAAVHRSIGELLRSIPFQRAAAANMPPLDAFEAPMMHAKRFLYAHCIRDNQFNLGALEAFCMRYLAPSCEASFVHAQPYTPPDSGNVSVTFEGEPLR